MVNRNVSLYSMLLNMWSRNLNVEDTLHYCTIMGFSRCVVEPQIKPVFKQLDIDYAAEQAKWQAEDEARADATFGKLPVHLHKDYCPAYQISHTNSDGPCHECGFGLH